MRDQLVLQWPTVSEADYDRLISLEEMIEDGLGEIGFVDGHDFGSGEMCSHRQTQIRMRKNHSSSCC
jgi:hypothetical protein